MNEDARGELLFGLVVVLAFVAICAIVLAGNQ